MEYSCSNVLILNLIYSIRESPGREPSKKKFKVYRFSKTKIKSKNLKYGFLRVDKEKNIKILRKVDGILIILCLLRKFQKVKNVCTL